MRNFLSILLMLVLITVSSVPGFAQVAPVVPDGKDETLLQSTQEFPGKPGFMNSTFEKFYQQYYELYDKLRSSDYTGWYLSLGVAAITTILTGRMIWAPLVLFFNYLREPQQKYLTNAEIAAMFNGNPDDVGFDENCFILYEYEIDGKVIPVYGTADEYAEFHNRMLLGEVFKARMGNRVPDWATWRAYDGFCKWMGYFERPSGLSNECGSNYVDNGE